MKIWDCFPFFNELMLLEIRLNEMAPFIDKFVLIEGTYTYSGQPKRLYYDEVKDNEVFAPFKDKIIHLIYDDVPALELKSETMRRIYEASQKNTIRLGLKEAEPNDIIIVTDLDEIINTDVFPIIKTISKSCCLQMKMFYYYFNCRVNQNWYYAAFCRFKDYETAQILRHGRNNDYHKYIVTNAGWHFSDLMPPEKIAEKLGAICHTDYDTDYFKDPERIRKRIEANEDIYERSNKGFQFQIEPLDAPKYVMSNQDKYKDFIK